MELEDDIMACFIEDAREHLAGIEANLMDLEQSGTDLDMELVNTIFRAAHSIKGGAGFLGLANVRDLGHKLESLLHMIRCGEIRPDHHNVSAMLGGFDLLRTLVQKAAAGDSEDISQTLDDLSALARRHIPEENQARLDAQVDVPLPGGGAGFRLDVLSIEQALQGGRYLYLVEYDLLHDVHARGKTPLDVISAMEASGLIVDCRMDLAAVGNLDGPLCNRIPFYLLFATIVEPDVVGYLFALDTSRITPVDPAALIPAGPTAPAPLAVDPAAAPEELAALRLEVLAALEAKAPLLMDLAQSGTVGPAVVQFLCAAHRSAQARGLGFTVRGADAPAHRARLTLLGFPAAPVAPGSPGACPPGACPLLGGGCAS